jgi:prephenate dehydrogenase
MMWGVLFTDLGTFVADVGAEAAQSIGHRGTSTHPLAG